MKKLLILLFSILISFNSYGGSPDGRGLKCERYSGEYYPGETIYMWFEDGFFGIPKIEGSKIIWKRYTYTEEGTKYIYFNKEQRFFNTYPFLFLKGARLNRETLKLATIYTFLRNGRQTGTRYKCTLQYYKQWIISDLQEIINASTSSNKI